MTATTTASKTGSAVDLKSAKLQGNELIKTPIGDIELVHNYFNDDASTRLFDELDYQRAAQSYIWSTPLVSMTTWRDREGKAFGVSHATDFVVLDSLKEKRGTLTRAVRLTFRDCDIEPPQQRARHECRRLRQRQR